MGNNTVVTTIPTGEERRALERELSREYPFLFGGTLYGADAREEFLYWYLRARDFRQKILDPVALELERNSYLDHDHVPREILEAACDYQLYSFWLPKVAGGLGVRPETMMLIIEQIAGGCLGLANLIFVPTLALSCLIASGSSDQFLPWLQELVRREKKRDPLMFALAITEASGGSDVQNADRLQYSRYASSCKRVPGGYQVNGTKIFISDGRIAEQIVVIFFDRSAPNPADSYRMFFVPRNLKGLSIGRNENKMGVRLCTADEVIFDDCFIPDQYVLTPMMEGAHSLKVGVELVLGVTRTGVGGFALGCARAALGKALAYARANDVRGRKLIEHDWVKHKLALMWRNIMAGRTLLYMSAAAQKDYGLFKAMFGDAVDFNRLPALPDFLTESGIYHDLVLASPLIKSLLSANMNAYDTAEALFANDIASNVKVTGTEIGLACSRMAVEICGIDGLRHDSGVEKLYRDIKLLMIYEGANQICDREIYDMALKEMDTKVPAKAEKLPPLSAAKPDVKWYSHLPNILGDLVTEEISQGTLAGTLASSIGARTLKFASTPSFADLLERNAQRHAHDTAVFFEGRRVSYAQLNGEANRIARALRQRGLGAGSGVAVMMKNSVEFLAVYYATQKLGMYCVPVNTALVADQLQFLLSHSEVAVLAIDDEYLAAFDAVRQALPGIRRVVVRIDGPRAQNIPAYAESLAALSEAQRDENPGLKFSKDNISTIMYTSGTTGAPKGVVYRYGNDTVRKLALIARLTYRSDDVLFTCLPLYHANALFLTMGSGLWMGIPVALSKKFSASRFWDEVNEHHATSFNALGAMIPILLKNDPGKAESENRVRMVLSAACPAESWQEFEKRFNLKIWEGYSSVDGGGKTVINLGNAPVGSIGKPMFGVKARVVDAAGNEVGVGEKGELWFESKGERRAVEYFKNEEATASKMADGYIHTGDIVYRDKEGYLYFVGRNTESMRRRGENVSAYEVENAILKHPDVLECAAYGIKSELGEHDIMCALVAVEGHKVDMAGLTEWLNGRLARYAIPRYFRVVKELPKTGTHRVVKQSLVAEGVTADTYDAEAKIVARRSASA